MRTRQAVRDTYLHLMHIDSYFVTVLVLQQDAPLAEERGCARRVAACRMRADLAERGDRRDGPYAGSNGVFLETP